MSWVLSTLESGIDRLAFELDCILVIRFSSGLVINNNWYVIFILSYFVVPWFYDMGVLVPYASIVPKSISTTYYASTFSSCIKNLIYCWYSILWIFISASRNKSVECFCAFEPNQLPSFKNWKLQWRCPFLFIIQLNFQTEIQF